MPREARIDLSAEFVRSILDYDPKTGIFHWRYRHDCPQKWNTRYAGRIAGTAKGAGYHWIQVKGPVAYAAHRLAWLYVTGAWPPEQIDHKNGNRSDNRIANLRPATNSNNSCHKRIQSNNTSGFVGVCFNTQIGKWEARINIKRKCIYRAFFRTAEAAHEARQIALPLAHGEFVPADPHRKRYAHERDKSR